MMQPFQQLRQAGFTLIEMVVVMVVTAIIAGIMVLFIRQPVQQYVDAAERADMADVADLALRRMAREIHGALPNSVRILPLSSGTMIEFIPTTTGGTYLDASDGAGTAPVLDFNATTAGLTFATLGDPSPTPQIGDYVVVYNLGSGFSNADAYAGNNRARITGVGSVSPISWSTPSGAATTITMQNNPFTVAAGQVPNASPSHRFQVVGQPVTFRCARQSPAGPILLTRHWGYGFNAAVADPLGTGSSALLASNVNGCSFSYTSAANIQHGLVGLNVTLVRATSSESITLSQQVNVENTP